MIDVEQLVEDYNREWTEVVEVKKRLSMDELARMYQLQKPYIYTYLRIYAKEHPNVIKWRKEDKRRKVV